MFNKKKTNFIEPKTLELEDEDSVAYFNRLYENTFNPEGRVTKSSSYVEDKIKETEPNDLYGTLDALYVNENDFEGYAGDLFRSLEDEELKQKDYLNYPNGTNGTSGSTEEAGDGKKKPFYKNISYISDAVGGGITALSGAVKTYGEWDYALDIHKANKYLKKAEKSTDEKEKAEYMKQYEDQKAKAENLLNINNETSQKIGEYGNSFSTTDKKTGNKVIDKANQVIKGGISSLTSMGAGAALTGGNVMTGMGITSYGNAKNEAENMGIENATQYALINAVIETGSELALPGSKGLKTLFTTGSLKEAIRMAGTDSAQDFLREVAKEYGQESLTELAHIVHEGFYVDGNGEDISVKSWGEGIDRFNTAGLTGAFMGGVTTGTANINNKLNGTYEPKAKNTEFDDTPTNPFPEVPTKLVDKSTNKTISENMADDINKALGTDAITEEDILNIFSEASKKETENNNTNTSENTLENTPQNLTGINTPENIQNAKQQGENAIEEGANTEIQSNTPIINTNAPFLSKTIEGGKEVYITDEGNTVNAKLAEMVAENQGIPVETLTKYTAEDSAKIETTAKADRIIDNIDNSIVENGVEETVKALNTDIANGSITEEAYNTAMQYVEARGQLTQNDTNQQELTEANAETVNNNPNTEMLTKTDNNRQEITQNDTVDTTNVEGNNVRYDNSPSSNIEKLKSQYKQHRDNMAKLSEQGDYQGLSDYVSKHKPDKILDKISELTNKGTENTAEVAVKPVNKATKQAQSKIDKVTNTKTFKDTFGDTKVTAVEKLNVEQKTATKLAKEMGRDVVFYKAEGEAPNGFYKDGTVFINESHKGNAMMSVLGHETFHSLKKTDSKTFNELVDWGVENFSTKEINKFLSKINNETEVERLSNNPKLLSEEMLAESFGTDFANKDFWTNLEKTNKTLFEKVKDFIAKIFKKSEESANDFLTKKHIKELRTEFEAIVGKLTDTKTETKETTSDSKSNQEESSKEIKETSSKTETKDDVKFATRKGKEFDKWFKDSVMVKENGKPETYYHTTNAVFDDFNDNAETKNGKRYGAGHYFTNKRTQPGYGYGKNRLSVNLDIKNPLDFSKQINIDEARRIATELDNKFGTAKYNEYRVDKLEKTINTYGENGKIPVSFFSGAISIENSDYRDVLLKYGYDGIVEYSGGEQYVVAFSNDQVNIKTRVDEEGVRFSTRSQTETEKIKTPLLEMAGKVNDLQLRTGIKSIYKMGINKNINLVETFKDAINMLASNTDDAITNQKTLENSLLDKGISPRESYILSKYFSNIVEVAKEKVIAPKINPEYIVSTSSNTVNNTGISTNGNSSSTINQVITSTNWKGQKGPIADRIGMGIERAYSRIVDTFHFAKKIAGDDVYRKARLTNTSFGIAENILTNNLTDKNGNVVDVSLKDMLVEAMTEGKELEIMDYVLHKHNIDRATQEKYVFYNEDGTPVSSAQSSEIVAKYEAKNPDFKAKAERLTGWINTFMKTWGVDTGILSEDLYNTMLNMYPSYVPTNRELNDHLELFGGSYGGKGFVDKSKPVKKLAEGGSARNIIDIRESLVNLVTKTVRTAKMNEVGQSLIQAVRTNPKMEGVASIVNKPDGDNPNVVRVLEKGEAVYVEIHNQDLLNMLEKVHTPEYGDITEAVKKLNNGVKQLITTKNPLFALTNTARDYQTYMVNSSEVNLRKRWSNLQEAIALIQQDIAGKDMTGTKLALYNAMGVNASGIMAKSSHKTIENLTGRKSLINQNTGAIEGYTNISDFKRNWTKIMDGLETLTGSTETAFRLAEFIGAINRGESIEEATLKSMEVTVDFSRSGDLTKQADAYVKYLNAGVQGLDNFFRKVAENPTRVLTRSLVHIAGPALILAALNAGDDEYEMLDDRTKDNNFLISLKAFGKEGQFIKIPKAREYGMVAMLAERLVYGSGFKNLGRSIWENVSPPSPISDNILSDIGKYGDDEAKDFAGRYIVPSALQDLNKKDQWDEDTTVLSKWLGQITGLSPKKLDYYLDSYSGILGDAIMPMLLPSTYSNKEDVLGKSTSFITNKFVADNTRSSSSSADYYDNLDDIEKTINREQKDMTTEEREDNETELKDFKNYLNKKYGKNITDINKLLKDSSLSSEEKKELKRLRNEAMKMANEETKMFLSPKK